MRLLYDENLSYKLVSKLSDLYPDSLHVGSIGLLQSPDLSVWEFAGREGCTVVSADSDFFDLPPPKDHLPK